MKIALLYNTNTKQHSSSWCYPWENFCKSKNIDYEIINPYKIEVVKELLQFDIILWHYSNYSFKDMLMARYILNTLDHLGKKVFPTVKDSWHFDDKLAETYLLESVKAPIPDSYYYYSIKSLKQDLNNNIIDYPTIAKLRNGSGSHNVKKIDSEKQLLKYATKMFSSGLNSAPSILKKSSSNIRSATNLKTFFKRAKRIPEFLNSFTNAKMFNLEKGYVYLQKMIPNDGFDLKIVVIGNKLSFIGRSSLKGDFRASGAGKLFYDKNLISKDIINSAFETSDKLGFSCIGYDYVLNSQNNKGVIIEISYGFSHEALLKAQGYFDRNGKWYDEPLNAPVEVLKNLINV